MIAIVGDIGMASPNPLIKRLRGYVKELKESEQLNPVTDDYPVLLPLCLDLENIIKTGLKIHYWELAKDFCPIEERVLIYPRELAKRSEKVQACTGRGRLFVRAVLNAGCLSHFIKFLGKRRSKADIYDSVACLVCEELVSLCQSIDSINFKLELSNGSFLDDTWLLPYRKQYELVPCKSVGITLSHSKGGWVVVVDVEPGSVAAEDDKIEVGDVIEELQGEILKSRRKAFTTNIMRKSRGLPIVMSVIKSHHTGEVYRPLMPFLKDIGLNVEEIEKKYSKPGPSQQEKDKLQAHHQLGYQAYLLGSCAVGNRGDACFIASGIQHVLSTEQLNTPVTVIPTESTVLAMNRDTDKVEMRFHYACISSVGRRKDLPTIAGFITGNTSCDIAERFECHVFRMRCPEESAKFLQEVAMGFKRTQCAV